ncbi:unnamed protein product [Cyprideis torosa]|uniref:Mediator of RNA polymerase II transcription subunit 19 n=1 Tax=Cyprideis torosa TaxID=163714 RepID=A0A7R8ZQ90_9CRUS|nr:unnamed protein product [Cyprideis torosa]CAG0902377.1 unnamed protein product [Cyprideis torosa]
MADNSYRQFSPSPKASPRGSRSPQVPRQDSTGTLRTTISLGKNPSIVQPFYLMKELPVPSDRTGASNLMKAHGLEHAFAKVSSKKVKESLSSFLPSIPGNVDGSIGIPGVETWLVSGKRANGFTAVLGALSPAPAPLHSLRSIIDNPPIGGKEIHALTPGQLAGFRLYPGPLPEQYRMNLTGGNASRKRSKHKKHKRPRSDTEGGGAERGGNSSVYEPGGTTPGSLMSEGEEGKPKHKLPEQYRMNLTGGNASRKRSKHKKHKRARSDTEGGGAERGGNSSVYEPGGTTPGSLMSEGEEGKPKHKKQKRHDDERRKKKKEKKKKRQRHSRSRSPEPHSSHSSSMPTGIHQPPLPAPHHPML